MIVFVVPLQSPAASRDWANVSRLAERTLRSVCRQSCSDFRVILVCNERPRGDYDHPALTVLERDFPLPGPTTEERMGDKGRKLHHALVHARQWAPFHFMSVDADDCVSRRLAALSKDSPEAPGWFFEKGYMHDEGSRFLYLRENFHLACGTSHIARCTADDLPASLDDSEERFWPLKYGHTTLEQFLRGRGTPLAPLPFPGAIYITATGENDSGLALRNWRGARMLLSKLRHSRLLTRTVREEFGLYDLDR